MSRIQNSPIFFASLVAFMAALVLSACAGPTAREISATQSVQKKPAAVDFALEGLDDAESKITSKPGECIYHFNQANYNLFYRVKYEGDMAKYNSQMMDAVVSHYTKALEANPKYAKAFNNRGVARFLIGDRSNGCSDFRRACELGICKNYNSAKGRGECQ